MLKRNVMRQFKMDEVSAVDDPAQEGAKATILKRRSKSDGDRSFGKQIRKDVSPMNPSSFHEAIGSIAKRDQCECHIAMQRARQEHPALFKRYQAEGAEMIAKTTPKQMGPSKAEKEFEEVVRDIMERDGVSRLTAMRRAASEHPALLQKYRAA